MPGTTGPDVCRDIRTITSNALLRTKRQRSSSQTPVTRTSLYTSGRRGSNSPPIAWKAIALPNELLPLILKELLSGRTLYQTCLPVAGELLPLILKELLSGRTLYQTCLPVAGELLPLILKELQFSESPKPNRKMWARMDSNHRTPKRTDLQSVAVGHLATCPYRAEDGSRTRDLLITNQLL